MSAACSDCGKVSRLNCGLRRERGTVRTSTTSSMWCAKSRAMKSSTERVEWPMVNATCRGDMRLLRQRVARADQLSNEMTALQPCEVRPKLDALRLLSQVFVPDGLAKPARVVTPSQMKHPRLFVKTLGDLTKHPEILRPQVESSLRTAKVEAVIAQIALRVLAVVADALGATGLWFNREGWLLVSDQPHHHLALLVRQARRPGERLHDGAGK